MTPTDIDALLAEADECLGRAPDTDIYELDLIDRLSTALRQEQDGRARRLEETIYLDGRIAELRAVLERARVALEEIKHAGLGRFGRRPDDIAAEALAELSNLTRKEG